jgi:PKD repeat protein
MRQKARFLSARSSGMAERPAAVSRNNFPGSPMNKSTASVYWITCLLMTALASVGSATTIVMPTDEQLVAKSPVIVRGVVLSSAPVDRNGAIWTETVLQIDAQLKGSVGGTITIREVGGIVGDRITKIFGAPEYVNGEHVLAFVTPTPRGDFQTIDLFVGKFTEARTLSGRRLWTRDVAGDNVTLLDSNFHAIESHNVQRDASRFEQFVANRVQGRAAEQNYGVENPVLAPSGGRLQIAPDFTLIAEPSVYRWFAFDNGGSAAWYSYGSQPGYSGGGVSELTTAMNVWSSYSAANIKYTYGGVFNGTPAGLAYANGTNEVLFNDPLGEIAGTWNPSTGGVVGQGGFNGVTSATNWTSPFSADATHLQQTYRAWNITEGNLVIQDNVSPSNRISSTTLAEIIAHELGHTLGLGHSADNTALMYATVTGLGPSLRGDDQLAARWLYPAVNSTPVTPPSGQSPAAPSGLTASASTSSVTLQWKDNSTNETGFRVYYATGASGGKFTSVGDIGAGSMTATVTGLPSGMYRFYVTAFNSSGESAASNTVSVSIAAQQQTLTAAFSFSPVSPLAGDIVAFYDASTGGASSWSWNFGDGTMSSVQSPAKIFGSAGSYTVTLTVVRDSESRVATQTVSVGERIPATPDPRQYKSLVPVTAQTSGMGGTLWRTELTMFNAGDETANITLSFVPGAGVAPETRTVAVLPRETRTYANALVDIFGMPSGAGGISIAATSATTTPDLKITSRTFAATPNGTYGQAVPDIGSSDLQNTLYMTGLIATADFRTNIGLVNKSDNIVAATLILFDDAGNTVERTTLSIPPDSFQQASLNSFFPTTVGHSYPLLSLRIGSGARDAVSLYASVVDNKTQDPVYIQARPLASRGPITVPVVARSVGAAGTFWRSDVTLFNPNGVTANLALTFRSPNGARMRNISIAPSSAVVIADVVTAMGDQSASGPLEIVWGGMAVPVVTSRTYTTVANGGTFGQSIDPVPQFGWQQYVTGLRSDVDFRTNVGFVNGGDSAITVDAAVLSSSGAQIGSFELTLAGHAQVQYPISAFVQGIDQNSIGACTLQATSTGASTLFAYGSVVDNHTGDPVFFAGK